MIQPRILAFAGSARAASYNKLLVAETAEYARAAGAQVTLVDLRDFPMPLYDGDEETVTGLPRHSLALRKLFAEHDGLLIGSPEHNGSVTALLKNLLDWVSRPDGDQDGLTHVRGKPVALVAASLSPFGGIRSVAHLRGILSKMGANVLADEVLVPSAHAAFDAHGRLMNEMARKLAAQLARSLAEQVHRLKSP